MTGVMTEKLFASHMLLDMADDRLRPNERVVRQSLTGWDQIDWDDSTHIDAALVALLRTGALFVMDADDSAGALLTMPPELPQLPPLPFRRVVVEMSAITDRQIQVPVPWAYVTGEGVDWRITEVYEGAVEAPDAWQIPLVGIVERIPRYVWDVLIPLRRMRPMKLARQDGTVIGDHHAWQVSTAVLQITPEGVTDSMSDATDPVRQWLSEWTLRNVVNVAHLMTARGAPRVPVAVPRPQRRRWQKRHGQAMPSIYRIDLGAAAEDQPPSGTKVYTVRWVQRGHWRHLPNGRETCTCVQHRFNPRPATWIDSMIKGPAGAPWSENTQARFKGRPVYYQRRPRTEAHA